uniref:Uncharacterized protein n=1 Tax=Amphimedon queenslandica TaxID=400682 RepID=A0A1X7VCG9_AMPQE
MSWEWRVFWRISKERKIILESLGLEKEPRAHQIRSDTYICCTREVGIKWRRGRQLEFKVMTERDEKSMAEKWNKILVTSCPLSINDEEVRTLLINHIDKLLKKSTYKDQLENARETLLAIPTLKLVEVHKERTSLNRSSDTSTHPFNNSLSPK